MNDVLRALIGAPDWLQKWAVIGALVMAGWLMLSVREAVNTGTDVLKDYARLAQSNAVLDADLKRIAASNAILTKGIQNAQNDRARASAIRGADSVADALAKYRAK